MLEASIELSLHIQAIAFTLHQKFPAHLPDLERYPDLNLPNHPQWGS